MKVWLSNGNYYNDLFSNSQTRKTITKVCNNNRLEDVSAGKCGYFTIRNVQAHFMVSLKGYASNKYGGLNITGIFSVPPEFFACLNPLHWVFMHFRKSDSGCGLPVLPGTWQYRHFLEGHFHPFHYRDKQQCRCWLSRKVHGSQ